MQDMRGQKWLWLSIVFNTSMIFTISSFLLCAMTSIVLSSTSKLPNIKANIIILVISLVISIVIAIICARKNVPYANANLKCIYLLSISYTALYILYYAFVALSGFVRPSLFVIIAIFSSSVIFAIIQTFTKLKNSLLKGVIYFILYSIPYFTIVFISNLSNGNKLFVALAVYLITYIVVYLSFFTINSIINKYNNESKEYKEMFK